MERRLKSIANVWKGAILSLKQKRLIVKDYREEFGIGKHTALNTLNWNGKRKVTAVALKEVEFLETRIPEVVKETKCKDDNEAPTLETLIDC